MDDRGGTDRRVRKIVDFVRELDLAAIPEPVLDAARRHLLDLLGVAAAGRATALARIVADYAVAELAAGPGRPGARLPFDGRRASAAGAALAGASAIDALDAHDGHRLTKGHVGCGVLPALLAASELRGQQAAGPEGGVGEAPTLASLVVGYEVGTRAGIALHRTATDYHTSGAWVAIAAAAVTARVLGLTPALTREALGVAEYHGPRSPMMRVIDHPSMLKDGSGQGAMVGVSAALLARGGFTGAPAATVEDAALADLWCDLGTRWTLLEQYLKLYPVCRWAQPAVAAALTLRATHGFASEEIATVSIGTFAEAARLDARAPQSTEEAQYSLPFPVAAALVHGRVGTAEIAGAGLGDARVRDLAARIRVQRVAALDALFPAERWSDVTVRLRDGRVLESGRTAAPGDPERPLDAAALERKFLDLAEPALGIRRAERLRDVALDFGRVRPLSTLAELVYPPLVRRA